MDMTNKTIIDSWSQFNKEDLANFGDDGDSARRDLIDPTIFKFAGSVQGKRVLDAGCGNGYLSRKLARQGATVTGIEPATGLFNHCVEKENVEKLGITYLQQDVAEMELAQQFDLVFLINVLMDVPDYLPLLKKCVAALKPKGELIISILHPAFPGFEEDWQKLGHVEVSEYFFTKPIVQKYGYYFPRPISTYINDIISAGCEIEELAEPMLADTGKDTRNRHVPQFLVIKARKS